MSVVVGLVLQARLQVLLMTSSSFTTRADAPTFTWVRASKDPFWIKSGTVTTAPFPSGSHALKGGIEPRQSVISKYVEMEEDGEPALPFVIPRELKDLEKESEHQFSVPDLQDEEAESAAVEEACAGCVHALRDGPLRISDSEVLRSLYVAVRGLSLLDPGSAIDLASELQQGLGALSTSGLRELAAEGRSKGDPVAKRHRSALQAYVYFLHLICRHFHAAARDKQGAESAAQAPVAKKRGAKAKASCIEADAGDGLLAWGGVRERILRAFARTLNADLDATLYSSPADKFSLATQCLVDGTAVKADATLKACQDVVCAAVAKHVVGTGILDVIACVLYDDVVTKYDHGPEVAAALAERAALAHGTAVLAKALINKFCEHEPDEFDARYKRDTKPVSRAAKLLTLLTLRLPAEANKHSSQLLAYFGCEEAYPVRTQLVECLGLMMRWHKTRSAISFLSTATELLLRSRDKSAFVRHAVLDTIEGLVAEQVWPLELRAEAARTAVRRLLDGTVSTVSSALGLLCTFVGPVNVKVDPEWLLAAIKDTEERMERNEDSAGPRWGAGPLNVTSEEGGGGADTQGAGPGGAAAERAANAEGQEGIIQPTQMEGSQEAGGGGGLGMQQCELAVIVASLKQQLEISRALEAALPEVVALLCSAGAKVAERAIQLLTLLQKKGLPGATDAWRSVWHSMLTTTHEDVRSTVLDAFYNVILPGDGATVSGGSKTAARAAKEQRLSTVEALIRLMRGATLQDQQALEEVLRLAVQGQEPVLDREVVRDVFSNLHGAVHACTLSKSKQDEGEQRHQEILQLARLYSTVCALWARHVPALGPSEVRHLVKDLQDSHLALKDALLVRNLASTLAELDPKLLHASTKALIPAAHGAPPPPPDLATQAYTSLVSVLVSNHLPESGWFAAAQAATAALYRLHPQPHALLGQLLRERAREAAAGGGACGAAGLARTLFLVGCVATQQLALVDSLAKRVRRERAAREKAAAEARDSKGAADDVDAQLGTGQARDAALDSLQEELEAEVAAGGGVLAAWGGLASGICREDGGRLLGAHRGLAAAALGALSKLMVVDAAFCEANCSVFFTRLTMRGSAVPLPSAVRCDMLVALGDLCRRHPNVLEPWTVRVFECLRDDDEEVTLCTLRVLSHLILADMVKPKGHMAHAARCLVAASPAVRDVAARLFNSLAAKQAKGGANKVHQYLPEIISEVTRGEPMAEEDFEAMMKRLLGYVKAEKLAESLKIRLCERFENVVHEAPGAAAAPPAAPAGGAAEGGAQGSTPEVGAAGGTQGGGAAGAGAGCAEAGAVREWRSLADCLSWLAYSEKGLRAVMERLRCFKHALGDERVCRVFKGGCGAAAEEGESEEGLGENEDMDEEDGEEEAEEEGEEGEEEEEGEMCDAAADMAAPGVAATAAAGAAAASPVEGRSSHGAEGQEGEDGDGGGAEGEHEGEEETYDSADDGEDEEDEYASEAEEDESASEEEGGGGAGSEDGGFLAEDMEMDDAPGAAATPLATRTGRPGAQGVPTPTAGTPMAITPAPGLQQQAAAAEADGDDMAWSPAPPYAAAMAQGPQLQQENMPPPPSAGGAGGVHIKADPDGPAPPLQRAGVVGSHGVLGVRIKTEPGSVR
ncbi:Condensin complex subunit 1 [Tetrabaena socialis]|uniref:Condensin complex subunit 1 n=1 Tax=Tetrabaena socialis TaxID=47790 RepID=A0A2J7ZWE1_9CHLO|nr:Condensin complex subunit 1 [Tetrabaena socialis]|eukprot:PNH04576.1 Condensin complex subunit 1 [Tetrabaena socialis]